MLRYVEDRIILVVSYVLKFRFQNLWQSRGCEARRIICYFMLDDALCVGYLPGFPEHWLVVYVF